MFFRRHHLQQGLTLIELVIFIVIVSVGIVGILSVFNVTVLKSGDPLVRKQAQVLAEGLLEEIQYAEFAICNGSDPNVATITTAGGCAIADNFNNRGETRPYYSVKEYATASKSATTISPIVFPASIAAPSGYTASVFIDDTLSIIPTNSAVPAGDVMLIQVTVTGPQNITAVAEGFRTRFIPK